MSEPVPSGSRGSAAVCQDHPDTPAVTVVGIGADGWGGLTPGARKAIEAAQVLIGGERQLALVPESPAERVRWPSPLLPALPGLLARYAERRTCVLASGDPTYHGIGSTLAEVLGPDAIRVIPQVSSVALACARLGWPQQDVRVVSVVGRPVELVHPHLQPGVRLLVLSAGPHSAAEVAETLTAHAYGDSELTVFEQLGSDRERAVTGIARSWSHPDLDRLNVVAVTCRPDPARTLLPTVPGLPDDAYASDGQLTKREVRAVVLSRLAPVPGQLLWDVGAGSGSVAIEWSRTDPSCRAVAIEANPHRVARIARNAADLGTPGLTVVEGRAPDALAGLEPPDAIFVGGGAGTPGLVDACWQALRPGGRLAVTAVTVQTETVLADWYARHGGDLIRLTVQRAGALGGKTGWRPMLPVTVWSVTR